MPLSFESPRFSLRNANFSKIQAALESVGHVVLTDVWNLDFLGEMLAAAKRNFATDDSNYDAIAHTAQIGSYIGGVTGQFGTGSNDEFFLEFERTGLPAALRHIFNGNFVMDFGERATRRVDPTVPARFTGLHRDFQLDGMAAQGLRSKRAITLWTPLNDCLDENTPRLLLLDRHDTVDRGNPREVNLAGLHDPAFADKISGAKLDELFDEHVYAVYRCYAPHVPLGGLVAFDHNVIHGSYRRSTMRTTRYSFDTRAVGEYNRTKAKAATYRGLIYRRARYPSPRLLHYLTPWKVPAIVAALSPYVKPVRALLRGR